MEMMAIRIKMINTAFIPLFTISFLMGVNPYKSIFLHSCAIIFIKHFVLVFGMYRGQQPMYVIGILVGLLVVVGIVLISFVDDENSALTGSTVIDVEPEQTTTDDIPAPAASGSASRLLDLTTKTVIDVDMKKEIVVGEYVVTVGHVKTMEKVGRYADIQTFEGMTADKVFYVVQATVMLTGLKEGYLPGTMFTLSDGVYEYFIDEEVGVYLFESNLLTQVMRSGVKRTGKVAFDVDVNDYDLLVYDDTTVYRMPLSVVKDYGVVT
jgi:hypothetical protein